LLRSHDCFGLDHAVHNPRGRVRDAETQRSRSIGGRVGGWSTQPILDACNAVIGFAKERFTKNLFSDRQSKQKPGLTTVTDESAQARYVADQILRAREEGISLRSQAVLFRASQHSAQLEIELIRRNIPFVKYGGLKFLEAAHIKDVLSVLRWGQNPQGSGRFSSCPA